MPLVSGTFRDVLRAELAKLDSSTGKPVYAVWAEEITAEAKSNGERMEIIKFLEGANPLVKLDEPEAVDDPVH
jgi:hypothetical protein